MQFVIVPAILSVPPDPHSSSAEYPAIQHSESPVGLKKARKKLAAPSLETLKQEHDNNRALETILSDLGWPSPRRRVGGAGAPLRRAPLPHAACHWSVGGRYEALANAEEFRTGEAEVDLDHGTAVGDDWTVQASGAAEVPSSPRGSRCVQRRAKTRELNCASKVWTAVRFLSDKTVDQRSMEQQRFALN